MDTPPPPARLPKLTKFEKLMYGVGSGGFQMSIDGINQLANPVYNLTLGLSPTLVGTVLMLSRLFDAFTDPIMGKISDDTRSRWGRRRPYMFVGSFLVAFAFVLIWRVNPEWSQNGIFLYYLGAMLFYFLCSTIQVIPYHTLGLEMTADYNERTVIAGYKMCFSFGFTMLTPWVFRFAQAEMFESTLIGVQYLSYILAACILIGGLLPAIFVKERYYRLASQQRKIPFWYSAKLTFQSRAFIRLTVVIVLAGSCVGMVGALGPYIIYYYVFSGDLKAGAGMWAIMANVTTALAFFCVPLATWMANRLGKVHTLKILLSVAAVGYLLVFFLYNRDHPWLALLVALFIAPNTAGFWTITTSMKADICDEDELVNGMRREGMFGSVGNWVGKVAGSIALLMSGLILDLTGFDVSLGPNQHPETLLMMRILFTVVPFTLFILAIFIVSRYPLTRERMAEIRTELEARRQPV